MRKLKLQVQLSIDGFVAGPNGEPDWMVWDWDNELKTYVNELTASVDTILMGRNIADVSVSHWTDVLANPDNPDYAFAEKMVETPKVVFTRTLSKSKWANARISTGDLTDKVNMTASDATASNLNERPNCAPLDASATKGTHYACQKTA